MPYRNNPDRRGRYTRHADRDLSQPRNLDHKAIARLVNKWQREDPAHRSALLVTFDTDEKMIRLSFPGADLRCDLILYLVTETDYADCFRFAVRETEKLMDAKAEADTAYDSAYKTEAQDTADRDAHKSEAPDFAPDIPVGSKEKAPVPQAAKPSLLQRILHYLFPGIK